MGPLAGVKVLELGRVFAAPACAQMLADLGAEVIKVEALEGDPMRHAGEGQVRDGEGQPTGERSVFAAINRNKQSISVDIATPAGADLVRRLAARSDVFIENFKVGDLARRGLDYASIREVAPDIIYLSVSGFGQTGPYAPRPGMDNILQGLTGYMSMAGAPDGPPETSPVAIIDFSAAMHAAVAVTAALYGRRAHGMGGQHIDISLLESGLALVGYKMVAALMENSQPPRGKVIRGFFPSGIFETADGWIQLTVATDVDWQRFCTALGNPPWATDARFSDRWSRSHHHADLAPLIREVLRTRTSADWVAAISGAGVMVGPVLGLLDAAQDPQVLAREALGTMAHAQGGHIPYVRNPIRYSETAITDYRAPPVLGADTDHILRDLLGMQETEIAALMQSGAIGLGVSAAGASR